MSGSDPRVKDRYYGDREHRSYMSRITLIGREATLSWFNNSLHNLRTAVVLRVFKRDNNGAWVDIQATPHRPGIYFQLLNHFPIITDELLPLTYDQFIDSYKGMRKIRYSVAKSSLELEKLTYRDASCKCFLKKEKDVRSDKPHAIPRVITFPDPRYGMCIGIYIKSVEHVLYTKIDEMFANTTVMKGKNYASIGRCFQVAWEMFRHPCAIDGDVSRLDSSISDEALLYTHTIVSRFFPEDTRYDLLKILSWQIAPSVRGRARDGSIKYQLSGLASGQMNTSLVGVLVVCSIIYDFLKTTGLKCALENCGDDFTLIGERPDIIKVSEQLKEHFAQFNMVLKLEKPVDNLEEVEFCQTSPVFDGVAYRMVRNPWNAIVKDSLSETPITGKPHLIRWLNAVGMGGLATHGDMPIFHSFYDMYICSSERLRGTLTTRSGRKRSRYTFKLDGSLHHFGKDMTVTIREPSETTRFSFFLAFGITPSDQRILEKHYSSMQIEYEHWQHHEHDGMPWLKLGLQL